jgi:outer membrane PBP1 activator LpoA protein
MLHVSLCGRQVRRWLHAALLGVALAWLPVIPADAARTDDLAAADALARGGRHAEAAALYESLAKRPFRGWDSRLALLAAREYQVAGRLDDADRMLARASPPARPDDAVLLARVTAEVALARGQPDAALDALQRVPEPWPAPLAAELLALRANAEFAAGRMLDGVRTTEARARILSGPEQRRENYGLLLDAMLANPAAFAAVPAAATPYERAWFELGQLLAPSAQADTVTLAKRAADWRARNANHPGAEFLPQASAATTRLLAAGALDAADSGNAVALLLPLSGRQKLAGVAVRDGFLAAALAEPAERRPRIDVYDTAALGAAAAYQRALAAGASAVAGPLVKEDIAALVAAESLPVPTVVLNALPGDAPPPFLFQFSLDPEQEARAAARRIASDGHVRGIALFPRNAWGERLEAAFTTELQATGVSLSAVQYYDPGTSDFSGSLRAALGRFGGAGDRDAKGSPVRRDGAAEALVGPQFAFIAATAQAARALRPQLRFQMAYAMPMYATSDAWDAGPRVVPDLDGLVLPEMPWILYGGAGAPGLWELLQGDWAAAGRGRLRLYAFGFDAYQLVRGLNVAARGVAVDGLTGRLTIAADGRVQRETEWAEVQGGRLQPAGSPATLPVPVEP